MQQAVVSNLQPITASPGTPGGRFTWTNASGRPRRGLVRVRSIRNGSTDNLDHLRRAPTSRQKPPQGNGNSPRRRVIQTTPFGLWDSFPEARTLDQMMRTMERIIDEDEDDRRPLVVTPTVQRADSAANAYRRGRTPWEIKERAGDYLARFDMPGMTREDVRVSVQDRTLVVMGGAPWRRSWATAPPFIGAAMLNQLCLLFARTRILGKLLFLTLPIKHKARKKKETKRPMQVPTLIRVGYWLCDVMRLDGQDRTLVVVAEKAEKQGEVDGENVKDEEEAWPAASYGRYRTRVELPENVEVEKIAAEVRDGVLYLNIPKVSPSGGKVVSIQVQ